MKLIDRILDIIFTLRGNLFVIVFFRIQWSMELSKDNKIKKYPTKQQPKWKLSLILDIDLPLDEIFYCVRATKCCPFKSRYGSYRITQHGNHTHFSIRNWCWIDMKMFEENQLNCTLYVYGLVNNNSNYL